MSKTTLVVLFNLKAGVSEADYEKFALETDIPLVGGLKSVDDFKVYKSTGILGSEASPPFQYFEVIQVNDLDGLFTDMGADEALQKIPAMFQTFADNPIFITTNEI